MTPQLPATDNTVAERHEFLSSVGHELRNPLTTIIAQVEILMEGVHGPLENAQKNALTSIQDSSRQMLHLLADAIDLCRIEADVPLLTPAACVVADICGQSITQAQDLARSRAVQVRSEISPENLRVTTDARRFRQMITELLSAVVLTVPTGSQVLFSITTNDRGLCLQARRTPSPTSCGTHVLVGSDAPSRSSWLDRLRKVRPIGTTLLLQLVRLHEGTLAITESGGQIVGFTIHLPVEVLSALETAPQPEQLTPSLPRETSPSPSQTPIVLVADDQQALVTVVRSYLENFGFQVITARDGREAVQLASTYYPDLIMMDVRMPVMDGLHAIREIRSSHDPKLRDVTIISLSGIVGAADKDECLDAGATDYLNKPFGVSELDRVIKDHLHSVSSQPDTVA